MRPKLLVIIAAMLMAAVPALAADVDGKWSGSLAGPAGDFQINFTFKADGATLTGSTTSMDGMEIPVKDGKIDGKNISFTVTFDFGGMPFTISYKGVVEPEQIKLTGDAFGMPFEFVVKKVK